MTHQTQDREPLLRINGWSVKFSAIIQVAVLLLGGLGAWYTLTSKVDGVGAKVTSIESQILSNRAERLAALEKVNGAIQTMNTSITSALIDQARLREQIENLQLLIGDLKRRLDRIDERPGSLEGDQ